jgi:hypothetical protein
VGHQRDIEKLRQQNARYEADHAENWEIPGKAAAYAASGGQQAGYAIVGEAYRASLWSGTAASWVDLHPAGSTESFAFAASGGQQAG